ncbi:hypothetical conserved protein [Candidatus Nitrosoglobus terrae]|uniref:Hypothetical conserved protein n=1 Tax=Candidatus Nitrosoglobus terrae TaxID=1630141 RepID=A0A1Q2SL04_9GAMM|nr:hypothetical protein [Candidatus Nitrosoglobus terrae]BAW79826.1 hypothetical conserved protein [Candidatus Nitrosoglobus terrae]
MREFAQFIMKGRHYAIAIAGLLGTLAVALPPFSLFSGATVGLVTLRHGIKEGLIVTAGAALIVATTFLVVTGRADLTFPLLVGLWLPNVLGCWILRITQSQALTLLAIGGFAALFAASMYLITGDVTAWWQQLIEQVIHQANIEGITAEQLTQVNALILMNGLVSMLFGLNLMVTILLARWWQGLLYNPGGFVKEFYALRLPRNLTFFILLLAIIVFIGVFDNKAHILIDILIISIMMYLFQGLAAIHEIVTARKLPQLWLLPVYLGLFFFTPNFIIGLATIGIVDSLINLRGSLSAKS